MRQIFVNLPVKDLSRSKKFFSSLGFSFDPNFTDDKGACLVIEKDSIYAMLLTEPFFKTFTPRAVADAKRSTEVLVAPPARATRKSRISSPRQPPPAARRCVRRRTTASCTSTPSKTPTATSGSWYT